MLGLGPIRGNLTNADIRQAFFLTLALTFILLSRLCHADTYSVEDRQRIGDVENYIRKQSLQGAALLPGEVRSAIGWFSGSWHAMSASTVSPDGLDGNGDAAPPAQPQALTEPRAVSSDSGSPFNLASNFHHKGFLPTHDAMVAGVGFNHNMLDNKLQFTARPFYGQNWRSLQGYWGTEMSMNIAKRADDLPWGKISLGYIGGNQSLTDHGSGVDLHGDVDLTEGWKFTSGLRQNSADGNSNYVMLRWHLNFDGNP